MTPDHLNYWAARHGISPQALAELQYLMGLSAPPDPRPITSARSEEAVQQAVRLRVAKAGGLLWRNNSGAFTDDTGRLVRYGLANDTAAVNRRVKSSDLIGITPVTCLCGIKWGVFTAYECKAEGWKYSGEKPCTCKPDRICTPCHERAQARYHELVMNCGGIGRFVNRVE